MEPAENSNLHLRGQTWHVDLRVGGQRYRRSTGTRDLGEARVIRDTLTGAIIDRRIGFVAAKPGRLLIHLRKCREAAIRRDRQRGREPSLSPEDVRALFRRSDGRCELTGIKFSLQAIKGGCRRPFAPSIDRIDNSLPYSPENARLVCVAVNVAVNEWGEDIFRKVAVGFLARQMLL